MKNKMKLLLILTLFFVGCQSTSVVKDNGGNEQPVISQPNVTDSTPDKPEVVFGESIKLLAWDDKHPDWDVILYREIAKHDWTGIKNPCKKHSIEHCVAQLISKSAFYESSWKPNTSYKEGFKDTDGTYVVSRGLMQISKTSANGYDCKGKTTSKIVDAKDLYDPDVNLSCSVKIFNRWGKRDGVLYGGKKDAWNGGSRYWAVLRCPKTSCNAIMTYVGGL